MHKRFDAYSPNSMEILYKHETIIQTGITCKNNILKIYLLGMLFKKTSTRYKQWAELFFVTRPPTCRKVDSCF